MLNIIEINVVDEATQADAFLSVYTTVCLWFTDIG